MAEIWRFIDFEYHSPAYNMALDEALLEWHSLQLFPPTIRFYGWNPSTLSIGYFQKLRDEINIENLKKHNIGLVRRLTGGRAVFHDKELTYSVIVSEQHPKMSNIVTEAYREISKGLLEGFKELGLNAYFSLPRSETEKERLKNPDSSICFDTPSWYEVVVEDKKIAGSAQTRQKGVILQHGSILLELNEDILIDLFNYPNERQKERLKQNFKNKAVAINDIADRTISMAELRIAFKTGFEKGLNVTLEPYKLTAEEIDYVNKIANNKYGNDDWTYLR